MIPFSRLSDDRYCTRVIKEWKGLIEESFGYLNRVSGCMCWQHVVAFRGLVVAAQNVNFVCVIEIGSERVDGDTPIRFARSAFVSHLLNRATWRRDGEMR